MIDNYIRCSSNEIKMFLNEERLKRELTFGNKYRSSLYNNIIKINSHSTWYSEENDRFDVGFCNLYENGIWVEKINTTNLV